MNAAPLVLSAVFFMLSGHPFITYAPSLRLMKRLGIRCPSRLVPEDARKLRSFALCVSAYNEEKVIGQKLDNLIALQDATPFPVEILIYVDAATDRTAEMIRARGDRIRLVEGGERQGKTAGMNRLVAASTADVVVFSDANVMVEPDALNRLAPYFADPRVGCVCGNLVYRGGHESATAAIGTTYWRHEERIKQLESDTGGVIGADGSLFAIRRALHRPPPEDIIDDFQVSLAILCEGYRVVRAGDVVAVESVTTQSADEFRRKIRISCQSFNVHRLMRAELRKMHWTLRYKYVSHKLLRWLSLVDFSLGFAFLVLGLTLWPGGAAGLAPIGLAAPSLAAILWGRAPAARRLREILLALVATTLGLRQSLRGERFRTWEPPVSRDPDETACMIGGEIHGPLTVADIEQARRLDSAGHMRAQRRSAV